MPFGPPASSGGRAVRDGPKRFAKLRGVTLPPSDPTPAIPGSSSWQQGAPPYTPPAFTNAATRPALETGAFELAGWGSRAGASIVDILLRLIITTAITVGLWALLADDPFSWAGKDHFDTLNEGNVGTYDFSDFNIAWMFISGLAIYVFFTGLLYAPITMALWHGATPGKRLFRIRVVREDGRDLGFGWSFVREPLIKGVLIGAVGGSVFFVVPLVNYLWPLWDRECRAGHDMLAKTRVVRTAG